MKTKRCSHCNTLFECGDDSDLCWCKKLIIPKERTDAIQCYDDCLCEKCLSLFAEHHEI